MLSKGVTAKRDSVIPAPNPAITVLGPDILPASSSSRLLYVSNATNPRTGLAGSSCFLLLGENTYARL